MAAKDIFRGRPVSQISTDEQDRQTKGRIKDKGTLCNSRPHSGQYVRL